MVFSTINNFFTTKPLVEQPEELDLVTMLRHHFSSFRRTYGLELGGSRINEANASYLVRHAQNPMMGLVVLKVCRDVSYSKEFPLSELGIPYSEFETQVNEYFKQEHPKVKKLSSD